ncbi:hypothetical protein DBA29_22480 [Xenophilus aerolatus]|nr:hypothetical protein [Xenophilus aerolatus]
MTAPIIAVLVLALLTHSTLSLWTHFVAVMRLKMLRDEGTLTRWQRVFGTYVLAKGLLIDLVYHLILGTLVLMEWPREWTLSGRLWRLSTTGTGWRQRWALALRVQLLDSADPSGLHRG